MPSCCDLGAGYPSRALRGSTLSLSVGGRLRVCLPSLFVDKILSIEVHPGAIESGLGLPILAESAMVPFSMSVDVPRPHPSLLESSLGKQHPLFQGNSFRLTACKLSEITLEVKVVGSFFWRTLSDSSWR